MKKKLSIILAPVLAITLLAGCASKTAETTTETKASTETTETKPNTETSAAGDIVKVGMGHVTSIAKSKDLGTKDGKDVLPVGQVDTVIVAVGLDKDGKVVKVTIDNAQTKVEFNKDLTLKSDTKAELKTKVELGDAYGMVVASSIKKEWYQQAAELEKWMTGKTIDEIKNIKTKEKDATHPAVPDVAELTSSVTISVEDYIAAVVEAAKNAVDVKGGATKLGLGHEISIAKSKALGTADGKEILPLAQVDTVMVVTAFDKDGKVAKAVIDNAQTKINFDKTGKVTSDKAAELKTKVELGAEYGMVVASSIKKEWFEQAAALADWMTGKTVDEIKNMKTKAKDATHPAVPDVAELTSSVTVSVEDYLAALVESSAKAK